MAYFLDAPNRELKTVAGRTQSNAVVWVGFIVFLASMLLRLFGATAIVGIPIIWIGIFLLAASVLLKFEPITLFAAIGWLAPILLIDWLTAGFLVA